MDSLEPLLGDPAAVAGPLLGGAKGLAGDPVAAAVALLGDPAPSFVNLEGGPRGNVGFTGAGCCKGGPRGDVGLVGAGCCTAGWAVFSAALGVGPAPAAGTFLGDPGGSFEALVVGDPTAIEVGGVDTLVNRGGGPGVVAGSFLGDPAASFGAIAGGPAAAAGTFLGDPTGSFETLEGDPAAVVGDVARGCAGLEPSWSRVLAGAVAAGLAAVVGDLAVREAEDGFTGYPPAATFLTGRTSCGRAVTATAIAAAKSPL